MCKLTSVMDMQVVAGIASRGTGNQQRLAKDAQRSLAGAAVEAAQRAAPVSADDVRLTSISHSRGVAVAASLISRDDAFGWKLGCDVECAAAPRPWREIGAFLTGDAMTHDARSACRAWTLAEAWFKAFGAWPSQMLAARALTRLSKDDPVIALASSVYWYSFAPVEGFEASIVWRGNAATPLIAG